MCTLLWVSSTGFVNKKGSVGVSFCTGIFNDHNQIMNSQISPETLPHPYTPVFLLLLIMILIFMVAIRIACQEMNEPIGIIQKPKDLESMLLNFTLVVLININAWSYILYWRQ